jgi:endonuclease/exonuclease/phosphatase family metal-dependent hydrolase
MNLKLLTWNLDGLSEIPLSQRLEDICSLLLSVDPDVILFQEIIPAIVRILDQNMMRFGYYCIDLESISTSFPYFCRNYLKITLRSSFIESDFMKFPQSRMYRGMNMFQLQFEQKKILIINTHLESCKESTEERKNQLHQCFNLLLNHSSGPAILAGDLNLRDSEVKSKKEFPELKKQLIRNNYQIIDCWEHVGSPPHSRFTWFMNSQPQIRARFDRVYYKPNHDAETEVIRSFSLLGEELIESGATDGSCYISDHCGVVVSFSFQSSSRVDPPSDEQFQNSERREEESLRTKRKRQNESTNETKNDQKEVECYDLTEES